MPKYHIEQKIRTLAENAVFIDYSKSPEFELDGLRFLQWDFNHGDGWLGDAWLASCDIEADTVGAAYIAFHRKLADIIPRVALISQCFINFSAQPFLITREGKDFALFRYTKEDDPVGLMFMDDNKEALDKLLADKTIPQEFYSFWHDAVNSTGYTSKILLMSSAVHALTKKPNGNSDYVRIAEILGEDLKDEIFAPRTGVRHRLSHGEYLSGPEDFGSNYVEKMHRAVIHYFNNDIFGKELVTEDVVHPHRNFSGSVSAGNFYIKGNPLDLKALVEEFDQHPDELSKVSYEFVHGNVTKDF